MAVLIEIDDSNDMLTARGQDRGRLFCCLACGFDTTAKHRLCERCGQFLKSQDETAIYQFE